MAQNEDEHLHDDNDEADFPPKVPVVDPPPAPIQKPRPPGSTIKAAAEAMRKQAKEREAEMDRKALEEAERIAPKGGGGGGAGHFVSAELGDREEYNLQIMVNKAYVTVLQHQLRRSPRQACAYAIKLLAYNLGNGHITLDQLKPPGNNT